METKRRDPIGLKLRLLRSWRLELERLCCKEAGFATVGIIAKWVQLLLALPVGRAFWAVFSPVDRLEMA